MNGSDKHSCLLQYGNDYSRKNFYDGYPWGLFNNLTVVIISVSLATDIHYHPSLFLSSKAMSLPLEWSLVRSSTLVGSSCAIKY